MSDPSMPSRAFPPRSVPGAPGVPVLMPRRAAAEPLPEFSDSDAESVLERLRGAITAGVSELTPLLGAIAESARLLTGAGGAAVALRCDGMVTCRARSGEPAPEIGVYLDEDSGISGQCLRTGEVVQCDDTLTDFRVNPVVCRTLGLRSIAIVPIRRAGETYGILEAFSTKPHAFGETHIRFLSRLAELAEMAQAQEQSRIDFSKHAKKELKPAEPAAAEAAPAKPTPTSLAPATSPAKVRTSPDYDSMVERLRVQLYDQSPKAYEPARRRLPILIAAGIAGLLALGVGWETYARPSRTGNLTAPPIVEADETNGANDTTITLGQAESTRPGPTRSLEAASRRSEARRPSARDRATARDVVKHEVVDDAPDPQSQSAAADSPVAQEPQPAAASAPTRARTPVVDETAKAEPVIAQPVKREQPKKAAPVQEAKAEPEKIQIAIPDASSLGSMLISGASVPKLAAPVSGGVKPGAIERQVQPIYPRFALQQRMEGAVVLDATIADTGRVQSVRVVSGQTILAQAAVDAVKQWRYHPTLLDGKPIPTETQITINFKAPR